MFISQKWYKQYHQGSKLNQEEEYRIEVQIFLQKTFNLF